MEHAIRLRLRIVEFICSSGVSERSSHPLYLSRSGCFRYLTREIGTCISLYGRGGPGGGIHNLVDAYQEPLYVNSTAPHNSPVLLWRKERLADAGHQVMGPTTAIEGQGVANIWVDYFE